MLWLGGELASEVAFVSILVLFYTCVVLVLSTAYLSCTGLFVSMY